jgi:hypothetical protein
MSDTIFVVCSLVGMVCFVFSIGDMGMNGSQYASFARLGLPIALICFIIAVSIDSARGDDTLIEPTPQEYLDIQKWIPSTCCWTNNCCKKVKASALVSLSRDDYRVVATGQEIKRTGWSQDGQTWRSTCDHIGGKWVVSVKANTRCIFPTPNGY